MAKKKRVYIMLVCVIALVAIVAAVVYFNSKPKSLDNTSNISTGKELVKGCSDSGVEYASVNESGLFYLNGKVMTYCDYTSGDAFALCDKANCLHADHTCGAYINGTAFAAYDGFLYAMLYNQTDNAFVLTRMELNGQDRTPILSFDAGEYVAGEYILERIGEVYYGYGNAYIPLEYALVKPAESQYSNGLSIIQLLIVDLDTGEKTVVAEHEGMDLYHNIEFSTIKEDLVLYSVTENPDALIAEELIAAIEDGNMDELKDMLSKLPEDFVQPTWSSNSTEGLYQFYLDHAQYYLTQGQYALLRYDVATGETDALYEGALNLLYAKWPDDHYHPSGRWSPLLCEGWYGDDLIVRMRSGTKYDKESGDKWYDYHVERWDLTSGERETLMELTRGEGAFIWTNFGSVGDYVHDGSKLFFQRYTHDKQAADVYSFDIATGEESLLYHDDTSNMIYRILGENADSFVLYSIDFNNGASHSVFLISKDDFYDGNTDNIRPLLEDG